MPLVALINVGVITMRTAREGHVPVTVVFDTTAELQQQEQDGYFGVCCAVDEMLSDGFETTGAAVLVDTRRQDCELHGETHVRMGEHGKTVGRFKFADIRFVPLGVAR